MKLEQQVCSLELAKKLKELGVKQESLFWWGMYKQSNQFYGDFKVCTELHTADKVNYSFEYSAFTVAELGEMLPATIGEKTWLNYTKSLNGWSGTCETISYNKWEDKGNYLEPVRICEFSIVPHSKNEKSEKSEADIRAEMLIYLIENKLMKF